MQTRSISAALLILVLSACGGNSSPNRPPQLASIADASIEANVSSYAISITASDRSDNLTFTVSSSDQNVIADAGLALTSSGRSASLIISPVADTLGTATVSVTATDPGGLSDTVLFQITVVPQEGVSFNEFTRAVFADPANAVPRDINSRRFDDTPTNFDDLVN